MTTPPKPTHDAAAGFIHQAIARLEEQSRLADELSDLARGQASLIAEGRADQLLAVLERRQTLIDRLLGVVEEIAPLADAIQQTADAATPAQRDLVRALVDQVGARLAEVIEIDSTDRARLHERLGEIQQEITVNGAARSASRAYGRASVEVPRGPLAPTSARFTDRNG